MPYYTTSAAVVIPMNRSTSGIKITPTRTQAHLHDGLENEEVGD